MPAIAHENKILGNINALNDLTDVDLTSPQNGQVPIYNSTTQKWENGEQSGGAEIDDTTTSTEKVWSSDKTNNAILGNIFPNRAVSQTVSGVTFTVNADKTITANGTYESQAPYLLSDGWGSTNVEWIKPFEGKTVCISGSIIGVTFSIRFYDENNVATAIETGYDGDEIVGVIPTNIVKYEAYLFNSGLYTLNNAVFKPMLRLTTELMRYTDNAVLGAKNLLPNNATSQTVNGITFTKNADGTITANGTASADISLFLLNGSRGNTFDDAGKTFTLSGRPLSGVTLNGGTCQIYVGEYVGSSWVFHRDNGSGITFAYNSARTLDNACIWITSGVTLTNAVFKPMIRLATDTDDTYVPFAMTNRELTEKKINIADLKTVVSASSDFADFQTRIASL